jgi:hypothetical protein
VRRGARAVSASASTVVMRAARTAGTNVPTAATARATATTTAAVGRVIDGLPGLPRRPGPESVSSGAVSDPRTKSTAAAASATQEVLREQHGRHEARRAADRLEQPAAPGLIGHPAADEHRDGGHGKQAEQPAGGSCGVQRQDDLREWRDSRLTFP